MLVSSYCFKNTKTKAFIIFFKIIYSTITNNKAHNLE